jgi:hypothetical protein
MSVGNLRSKLPTTTFPSVLQSVTTNGNFLSVVTDWITNEKVFEFKKKDGSLMWRFWRVIFSDGFKTTARTVTWLVRRLHCRRNHQGIWNGRSVRWRVNFSIRITDGITDRISSVKPSEKVNICQLCLPSPPLFLLLLPNPNSPHLQTTSPPSPPNKNLPHISTTSYISWSFVVTASVFWFTDGFYQFL